MATKKSEDKKAAAPVKGAFKREDAVNGLSAAERKALDAYVATYLNYLGIAKTERRAYAEAVR